MGSEHAYPWRSAYETFSKIFVVSIRNLAIWCLTVLNAYAIIVANA
jgi:hypothetical protein